LQLIVFHPLLEYMGILIHRKKNQGFTLLELMVTVAIAAILVTVAMPSFTNTIIGNRLTTINNELVGALNLARSEAIKRNQQVVIRKTGTNWQGGWQVFVDVDRTPSSDANVFNDDGDATLCESNEDCVLRVYSSLPAGYTISSNNYTNFIRYTPTGQANTNGTFAVCQNNDASKSKEIIIVATGRARLDGGNTCAP
jgi:type IV fimbrial biogenesis protein FimT